MTRVTTKRELGTREVTMHPPQRLHLLPTNPTVVALMRLAAVEMTRQQRGRKRG